MIVMFKIMVIIIVIAITANLLMVWREQIWRLEQLTLLFKFKIILKN